MSVIAPRTRDRGLGEPSPGLAALRALVTVLLVTAVVAAALGGATYVASRVLVGMLSA